MNKRIKLLSFAAVLIVNLAGLFLRYFELDTYFILIGFRFHISFVLPFLFIFRSIELNRLKQILVNPDYKKNYPFLLWLLIPLGILIAAAYLINAVNIGDPEYFYEFGLSSIVDYPIYLFWNFPQLMMFGIFLMAAVRSFKHRILWTFFFCFSLFLFEFIPLDGNLYFFGNYVSYLLFCIGISLIITYYKNIYWFGIFLFTAFWLSILLFGSSNKPIINLIFAAQYEGWEGFLEFSKETRQYITHLYFAITALLIIAVSLFIKKENSKESF